MDAVDACQHLAYRPDTGYLEWVANRGSAKSGDQAGYISNTDYRRVQILGKEYAAHRVAWLIYYGQWPENEIDHINGDKLDNRITNLRDITTQQNRQNLVRARVTNRTSGLLGAYRASTTNKWRSQIRVDGRIVHLGTFDSAQAAHAAYVEAKRTHHAGNTL